MTEAALATLLILCGALALRPEYAHVRAPVRRERWMTSNNRVTETTHVSPQALATYRELIRPILDGVGGIRLELGSNVTVGINQDGTLDFIVLEVARESKLDAPPLQPDRNLLPEELRDYSNIYDGVFADQGDD